MHATWRAAHCQPNYRRNVVPDPGKFCGPYEPDDGGSGGGVRVGAAGGGGGDRDGGGVSVGGGGGGGEVSAGAPPLRRPSKRASPDVSRTNHDTVAMFASDSAGRLYGATSTNGARGKVPGRVGDSPIPGAGLYVVAGVGGCGATGDGDVMMRFLPCYQAVESMRLGATPAQAAQARPHTHPQFLSSQLGLGRRCEPTTWNHSSYPPLKVPKLHAPKLRYDV